MLALVLFFFWVHLANSNLGTDAQTLSTYPEYRFTALYNITCGTGSVMTRAWNGLIVCGLAYTDKFLIYRDPMENGGVTNSAPVISLYHPDVGSWELISYPERGGETFMFFSSHWSGTSYLYQMDKAQILGGTLPAVYSASLSCGFNVAVDWYHRMVYVASFMNLCRFNITDPLNVQFMGSTSASGGFNVWPTQGLAVFDHRLALVDKGNFKGIMMFNTSREVPIRTDVLQAGTRFLSVAKVPGVEKLWVGQSTPSGAAVAGKGWNLVDLQSKTMSSAYDFAFVYRQNLLDDSMIALSTGTNSWYYGNVFASGPGSTLQNVATPHAIQEFSLSRRRLVATVNSVIVFYNVTEVLSGRVATWLSSMNPSLEDQYTLLNPLCLISGSAVSLNPNGQTWVQLNRTQLQLIDITNATFEFAPLSYVINRTEGCAVQVWNAQTGQWSNKLPGESFAQSDVDMQRVRLVSMTRATLLVQPTNWLGATLPLVSMTMLRTTTSTTTTSSSTTTTSSSITTRTTTTTTTTSTTTRTTSTSTTSTSTSTSSTSSSSTSSTKTASTTTTSTTSDPLPGDSLLNLETTSLGSTSIDGANAVAGTTQDLKPPSNIPTDVPQPDGGNGNILGLPITTFAIIVSSGGVALLLLIVAVFGLVIRSRRSSLGTQAHAPPFQAIFGVGGTNTVTGVPQPQPVSNNTRGQQPPWVSPTNRPYSSNYARGASMVSPQGRASYYAAAMARQGQPGAPTTAYNGQTTIRTVEKHTQY